MYARHTVVVVLAATLLTGCAVAWAAGGAKHPIWWSPSLGLESVDAIDDRLNKKFGMDHHGLPIFEVYEAPN